MTLTLYEAAKALLEHYGDQEHGPRKAKLVAELRVAVEAIRMPTTQLENPYAEDTFLNRQAD